MEDSEEKELIKALINAANDLMQCQQDLIAEMMEIAGEFDVKKTDQLNDTTIRK